MEKVEIELTEEQFEKFKTLESKGISAGEAIDMLFDIKENLIKESNNYLEDKIKESTEKKEALSKELEELDKELEMYHQIKDDDDYTKKLDIFDKEYGNEGSYEMEVQKAKRGISWAKDIIKF